MSEAQEHMEHAEHAEHATGRNRTIALLIAVLALFLALSETLGKSAQTEAISANVEASNLWAFFQAKTIRMTSLRTAADAMKITAPTQTDAAVKAAMEKQIDAWQQTANRYDDEPSTDEGRKQLTVRAKHAEEERDLAMARYHHYELASAAFQIGIVLSSATIITGMVLLSWIAVALGIAGLGFTAIGLAAPLALHLL